MNRKYYLGMAISLCALYNLYRQLKRTIRYGHCRDMPGIKLTQVSFSNWRRVEIMP